MNKNNKIILFVIAFLVAVLAFYLSVRQNSDVTATEQYTTVSFTNSITGEQSTAAPAEGGELTAQTLAPKVAGIEKLNSYYKTETYTLILQNIQKYMQIASNSQSTQGGIIGRDVSIKNDNASFKLFVDKPAAIYKVDINFPNGTDNDPEITFVKEQK